MGLDSKRRKEAAVVALQNRKITANEANTARSLGVPRKGSNIYWEGLEIAKKLLQLSRNLSYKSKLNVNELRDAEEELQNSIHSAAFDIEGMITAMVCAGTGQRRCRDTSCVRPSHLDGRSHCFERCAPGFLSLRFEKKQLLE